jgi:subtilase family serine protease
MGRRVRTPMGLGAAAVAAAAALGCSVVGFLPTGATAAPNAPDDLTSLVRAVSDPHSPQYRHFLTPSRVAGYMPTSLWGSTRAATVGDGHLMHPQEIPKVAGAQACSSYFGQLAADAYPAVQGSVAPLAVCGYTPEQLRTAYDTDSDTGRGVTVAILGAYGSPTMPADADKYAEVHGDSGFREGQYTQNVTPSAWNSQGECGAASWAAEETLDVEAVHAMAPRASIVYVGANSCQDSDMLAALARIVRNRSADVVTGSWGSPLHTAGGDEPASTIALYDRLFQIAALEGMTVDFAAGDCGANLPDSGCGKGLESVRAQTTFPASDPWVTAVGGTSLAIGGGGEALWQSAWGTRAWELQGTDWKPLGWVFGGGGGPSEDFAQPWYQVGSVPNSLATTLLTGRTAESARRVVPDLSLDADPFTGMLVGQTTSSDPGGPAQYAETAVGGTSLASPLLAGLEADMAARVDGRGGGERGLGFLDPALYVLAGTRYVKDVTDSAVVAGQIFPPIPGVPAVFAAFGDDGPLTAAPGYDAATGLGTPGEDFTRALDRFTNP